MDEEDDIGFIDGDIDTNGALAVFNFATQPPVPVASATSHIFNFNSSTITKNSLIDNIKIKTEPNNITPKIEGEAYTVGRYYKLRYSTAKMLNEIKASHPDVNVYMNILVDEAIRHYYSFCFKKRNRVLLPKLLSILANLLPSLPFLKSYYMY